MYKKNRLNIRISVVVLMAIIFIFLLITSCNNKKIKLSKDNSAKLEYTYLKDKFIFNSSDKTEKSLQIIESCVDFYEKTSNKYKNLAFSSINYLVGNSFSQKYGEVSLPENLNNYISHAELYLASKMGFIDVPANTYIEYPHWLRYGLTYYLYKNYVSENEKEQYGEYFYNNESIKRYITINIKNEPYQLKNFDFSQLNDDFKINKELSTSFITFLINKFSEEIFFNAIENYKNFDKTYGFSVEELTCMWLSDLGIEAKYYNGRFVFLLETDEYHLASEGYDNMIVFDKTNYYISSNYLTETEIFDFSNKYINDIDNVKQYFVDNDFSVASREINYKIIDDTQIKGDDRQYLFIDEVKEKKSLYISNFLDNHIASPVLPWLKTGMQGLMEKRYNTFSDFSSTKMPTSKEILSDSRNHYLLSFDKDYFLKGDIVLEQTENVILLSIDFTDFLEKHIGTKKLVEVYTNEYDFEKITGKTVDELKEKWLESIGIDKSILTDINYQDKNNQDETINVGELEKIIQKTTYGYIYETGDVQYFFPENYLSYVEMWEFIQLCEQSIEDIKAYLGHKFLPLNEKLEISISDGEGASFSYGKRMVVHYVKDKKAEYVHEMVHLLTGYDSEIWISEGLATYLDSMFSKWITPPLYGQALESKAKEVLSHGGKEGIIDFNHYFFTSQATPSEHMDAYILAASFVKYIEKEHSRKILLEMFSDINKTKDLTGYTVDELKNQWLTSLS